MPGSERRFMALEVDLGFSDECAGFFQLRLPASCRFGSLVPFRIGFGGGFFPGGGLPGSGLQRIPDPQSDPVQRFRGVAAPGKAGRFPREKPSQRSVLPPGKSGWVAPDADRRVGQGCRGGSRAGDAALWVFTVGIPFVPGRHDDAFHLGDQEGGFGYLRNLFKGPDNEFDGSMLELRRNGDKLRRIVNDVTDR